MVLGPTAHAHEIFDHLLVERKGQLLGFQEVGDFVVVVVLLQGGADQIVELLVGEGTLRLQQQPRQQRNEQDPNPHGLIVANAPAAASGR